MGCIQSSCLPNLRKFSKFTPDLSKFLDLPRDLTWQILDYVPELIPNLRLASRSCKSLIDDYIRFRVQCSIASGLQFAYKEDPGKYIMISLEISARDSILFPWRLGILNPSSLTKMKCERNQKNGSDRVVYHLEFFGLDYEILTCYLHKIIREEINGRVVIRWSYFLWECKKILKDFRFKKLKVLIGVLVDETAFRLQRIIEQHEIDELTLYLVENATESPVNFFVGLSKHLRSLEIIHFKKPNTDNELFTFDNLGWGQIIVDALSGNLDTLRLHNCAMLGHVSRTHVLRMSKALTLLDKPFFFYASFEGQLVESSCEHNGHDILVTRTPTGLYGVGVRHASRRNQ